MAEAHAEWRRDGFVITTDPGATDLDQVCGFLRTTYWAAELTRAELETSIRAALVYNLLEEPRRRQVGFARVVTDHARFAWLSDVFVLDPHRGRGLGTWLVGTVMGDPRVRHVRRWLLGTRDAHPLYRKLGWDDVPPGRYMVLIPQRQG